MGDRFKSCTVAFEAVALLIALGSACAAETLQPKDRAPQDPSKPPRFLYIHCAAGDYERCGLDPAMQRLNGGPQLNLRKEIPAPTPPIGPDFAPGAIASKVACRSSLKRLLRVLHRSGRVARYDHDHRIPGIDRKSRL